MPKYPHFTMGFFTRCTEDRDRNGSSLIKHVGSLVGSYDDS